MRDGQLRTKHGAFTYPRVRLDRVAALRNELDERSRAELPPAYRSALLDEACLLLEANERYRELLMECGLIRSRGGVRVAYVDHRDLSRRLAEVLDELGATDGGKPTGRPAKPTPEELITRLHEAVREANGS